MKIIILYILIILNIGLAKIDSTSYSVAHFKKGLPEELSVKLKQRLGSSYFLEINGGKIFSSFFIVNKGEKLHPDNFIFFCRLQNCKYFSFSRISFTKSADSTYSTILETETNSEDSISPLTVIYSNHNKILYRWESDNFYPKIVREYPYKIGKKLPDFLLHNQKDQLNINSLKGKIVVINWWATNCAPCIAEIPGLNTLVKKYSEIVFISIIYDKENLEDFLKKHEFNYIHYFGNKNTLHILGDSFPRNIILNDIGTIVYNKVGAHKDTFKDLEKVIISLKQ